MSATRVLELVATAGVRIADPAYRAVTIDQWVGALNEVAREMSKRMRLKKRRATFSLEANNPTYTYPNNMIQMVSLEYNPTPSDQKTWRKLGEMFKDEFDQETTNSYPAADPTRYYADAGYFYLVGMPTTDLTNGGRITYWSLPDVVTSASTQFLPIHDAAQDVLLVGMLQRGYMMLEKYDVADRMETKYERMIAQSGLLLEDRSDDRRQSVRPRSLVRGYSGQT